MLKKSLSLFLVLLHLVTFGPIKDACAYSAQSASYKLNSGATSEGGANRVATSLKVWQDSLGEPCTGKAQSVSFILNAGNIATILSSPPTQNQTIPNQSWQEGQSKNNAFDLDDYFTSPDCYNLTYTVSGNTNITVKIDATTHKVSFSQPQAWFGTEKIKFTATDTDSATVESNEISLQVEGVNNPPVLDFISDITVNENQLVKITPHATDLDGDPVIYSFSAPLNASGEWQTDYTSSGTYNITVTAKDSTNLIDTQLVKVIVKNVNRPPVINSIPDIAVNEGDMVTIFPTATDPDNDALTFYYSSPFDTSGKWLTNYNSAGTYNITVTVSDGIDTVSKTVKVIIKNVNRSPQASLTLDKYTVSPNEQVTIYLSATDLDNDLMIFSLKKDGTEIASGNITSTYTTTASFSALGDHNISLTVTDAGLLSSTDTKGVHCADPNANREAINPVMGDFNGDALTDLGLHNSDTGTWEICISSAGTFRNAVNWLTGFGTSREWWPIGGDFNGDAKTDAGVYNNSTGELKIALSTGSSFSAGSTWLTFPGASYSWQPFTGNFNADKYADIAFYNKDTGEVKVALGTGSGFGTATTWITSFGNSYIAMSGDFNADGLSDFCLFNKSSGEFKIAFSNSKAFIDGSTWITGFATDRDALVSDFDNDGLTDIGWWDKTGGKWYYAISTGAKFIDKGLWLSNFGTTSDDSATTGDFDGNGITDAACFDRNLLGINRWKTQLSTNKPADLLTEVNNGIGGKTQVVYTYAAMSDNSALPFPVYVASSVSLVNTYPADRAASYTQSFIFSGGYYDAGEREFRGFNKVRVTDPITKNYSETYFYQGKPGQDGALKGQIDKITSFDGNAKQISLSTNTYQVSKAGPADRFLGFPALIETNTTIYEENGTSLSTKNKFTYDNIGNVLEQRNEGDATKTGDEKSALTTYAQAYECPPVSGGQGFNRPLEVVLKDKDAKVISKKNFEYDSKGNLIKDTIEIINPITSVVSRPSSSYSYDSFGNLTSTKNALGSTVTTEYESIFYAYPQKVTNSLDHSIQYIYEPKFGAVKSVTDTNGVNSRTNYDTLARPTQAMKDNGSGTQVTAVSYSYPDFNTKITTGALNFSSTEYIDGLGRKYKTVSQGEDGVNRRDVSSEVYYNNRGLTEKESLAHYVNEDSSQIAYVKYEYDIRGRVKKTISDFPGTSADAQSTINYINPLYVETIDPLGHKKGVKKDVFGNNIEITEFTSGGVYKTTYTYDIQNNLTKTTDSKGNITQIFYDSIGRKLKMIDPDMGTWFYEYDLIDNLTKQTDAKGQVIKFTYDPLNRLLKKVSLQGTAGGEAILAQYLYDDSIKPNCTGRLSKVTDQSGSTEFFYDKLGREIKSIKTIDGTSYTVERTYDVLDRLVTLKYPDAEIVTYTYDTNSGLLESLRGTKGAEATMYVQNTIYNAKGQIKVIKYGNGTQTDYTYGQDLRLSKILTQNLNATPKTLQDLNYLFDKNGNVSTLTDNLRSNVRTYVYDDLDRLTRANNSPNPTGGYTTFTFQYDSIGNMTYKSDLGVMTYPTTGQLRPHAVTKAGGYTYQYDANGNMTVGKNKTLAYDTENRLIQVNELGKISTFAYDGDGGRVKKASSSVATTYIGSLFETDSSGKTTKHIFAGANRVTSVIVSPAGAKQSLYYHTDHLGSSNVITDGTGVVVQKIEYTPYGSIASTESRPLSPVPQYLFTGKELDSTNLYYYGARYYDPVIGRFITADSIVQAPYDPQSLNRYSYCRNNPINYVDPTGHFFWFAALIFVAAFTAIGAVANVAIAGATGQLTSWTAFWAAMGSGAIGGTVAGIGSFVPGAATILGGILIGAAAGGAAGAVGSSISGAFSWGAVGLGAAYGGTLGGFGNSSVGRAFGKGIGKAIGKLPYGQHIQNVGQAIGNKMGQLYQTAKGSGGSATSALNINKADTEQWDRIVVRKSGQKQITVIGAREDTAVAKDWPNHNVLDIPDWTLEKNIEWLDAAHARGDEIYLATDPVKHYIKYPKSTFPKEIEYLETKYGYRERGVNMVLDGE